MRDPTAQAHSYEGLRTVIDELARFDEPDLLAKIAASQAAFRMECLAQNRCLDEQVVTHLPLIALMYEHLCFVSAFQRADRGQLAERLEYKLAYELISARGVRALLKATANSSFYFTRLEHPAMTAMAAIATGSEDATQWLCEEFLRHWDAEQLEGSYDEEFLAFCALLANWHLQSRIDELRRRRAAEFNRLVDSHIKANVSEDIASVILMVDTTATGGATFGQLADYIAMVGLARIDLDADFGNAGSILRVFAKDAEGAPKRLTNWEHAFLKALYQPDRPLLRPRTDIMVTMREELAP